MLTLCSSIADEIKTSAHGWLDVRSLRDPGMQEILNKADPDWKWRPTLLLIEEDRVRVVQGAALLSRIAIGIGPRQAMRIASLVGEQSMPAQASSPARRTFLVSAAAGVATLAGAAVMGRPAPAAAQSSGAMAAADDELVAQPRATPQIAELENAIAVDFDLEPVGTVRQFDSGESETLLFYPSKVDPDNVAAALVWHKTVQARRWLERRRSPALGMRRRTGTMRYSSPRTETPSPPWGYLSIPDACSPASPAFAPPPSCSPAHG